MNFYPCNRKIYVELIKETKETEPALVYTSARKELASSVSFGVIVEKAEDCKICATEGEVIAFHTHGLEEFTFKGEKFLVIDEVYVLGVFGDMPDED